jgi:hypothetical protein
MTEMNATNINDLPTDPTGGGSIGGNVNLVVSEQNIPSNNSVSLDQTTISQIVNGLQQATVTGATSLPSRDIPQVTTQLTQDSFVNPNYIPPSQVKQNDYIQNEEITMNYSEEKNKHSLDSFYDEFQTPLLLGILFFIFQLPVFKKTMYKYGSFLCSNDGNYNLNGLIFVSSLFGFIYYVLTKFMNHFSKF